MAPHSIEEELTSSRRSPVLRFGEICLRGASQVFFQDRPLTGACFLAGIMWASAAAGTMRVAVGAVVGLFVGTLVALLLKSEAASLEKGLFGFNPMLVGVAVPTFLADEPMMWVYLVIGAAAAHVTTLAVGSLLKPYGVAGSTGPFVITTWLLLLGAYGFAETPILAPHPALPREIEANAAATPLTPVFLGATLLRNVSQVFLVKNAVAGALFVVGIAFGSPRAAAFALLGTALAMATALLLGADGADLAKGLYGFSPVLTAIALGAVFLRPSLGVTIYAVFGTIFSVIVQGAMDVLVLPFGIPTLTMPFVLTMWLFTPSSPNLAVVAHSEEKTDAVHAAFDADRSGRGRA